MTAYASLETAVEAMRRGAFDYLPKPCTPEQLRQVLARVERTRKLENRVAELESRATSDAPEFDLQSASPRMQRALDVAFKAAQSEATILILGENRDEGEKRALARRHPSAERPRVGRLHHYVSCTASPRELLESDLFGHAGKAQFHGRDHEDTWGKVTAADGGTLFLDEIGDLPLEIQARLLRLLQEREYGSVGETKSASRQCLGDRGHEPQSRDRSRAIRRRKIPRGFVLIGSIVISVLLPPWLR